MFNQENFLAQTQGFDGLTRQLLDHSPLRAIPQRQPFSFTPALIRTETMSIGSATGRKGYPFPQIQVYYGRGTGTPHCAFMQIPVPMKPTSVTVLAKPSYRISSKSSSIYEKQSIMLRPYGYKDGELVSILASQAAKGGKSGNANYGH